MFMSTLIPALAFYALGVLVAWFIWGRSGSEDA
jgi:hypothetical protein